MRTASGYHAPAVPYHTLICGSFSTPNTALVRKNAEYITNTEYTEILIHLAKHSHLAAAAPQALVARPLVAFVPFVPYLPRLCEMCEAPRVAQSCTLLEMGTSPFLVSER